LLYSKNWSSPGAIVGGFTIRPSSSIQTALGTWSMPKSSAVRWAGSTATAKVGAAFSIQGRAVGPGELVDPPVGVDEDLHRPSLPDNWNLF
jgi:hypothetical protein